jgi:ATP-dependent Lhr-like helicase
MATDALGELQYLLPCSTAAALDGLAPAFRLWLQQQFGAPTWAQRLAWPALTRGENLLLASPTGSGKTLAAFGPILSQLIREPAASLRCLYLAPLKALAGDVRKNLRHAIRGIKTYRPDCAIRVGVRTGDTSARLRRKLLSDPPAILLTTPESLAIMLTHPAALAIFQDVRWVIVDEIHSLAANKRGADLSLSLERLESLLDECRLRQEKYSLQRIGLSATCAPLEMAARFLVGNGRHCSVAQVADNTPLDLHIEPLAQPRRIGAFLPRLLERLEPELGHNRTTLIFTNVRSLAERLTWAMRRRYPDWAEQIAVHHSSLSAARRRSVERRLKHGKLRAVISSTSLELGIDIGTVDGVVLVHPPGGVVRLLQRIGRAGHGPGRIRRGLVLAVNPPALLEAAVTGASGKSAQIEPLQIPEHPLDVLCQQLLGMAAQGWWSPEGAFSLVCRAFPYRDLSRHDFDACIDYLSGRRRDGSAWLPTRLRWEGPDFTIADDRTMRILRRNIGTILTEDNCQVRQENNDPNGLPSLSPVGEVDELFADHLQPGDRFVLDGRCLEYRRKEGLALVVSEVIGRPRTPRWSGTGLPLSPDLARRLYLFRIRAAETLRDEPDAFDQLLQEEYGLSQPACLELRQLFAFQEKASQIPDLQSLLIEWVRTNGTINYYLHTPLNQAVNDALARVASNRLQRDHSLRSIAVAANLGVLISLTSNLEISAEHWRRLFAVEGFEADLDRALQGSTILRERFGRVALTGLMCLRHPLGRRRRVGGHDWAGRRLYDQLVQVEPDFVLIRQARREMRQVCAAQSALAFAEDLPGRILCCRRLDRPSPLAECWGSYA